MFSHWLRPTIGKILVTLFTLLVGITSYYFYFGFRVTGNFDGKVEIKHPVNQTPTESVLSKNQTPEQPKLAMPSMSIRARWRGLSKKTYSIFVDGNRVEIYEEHNPQHGTLQVGQGSLTSEKEFNATWFSTISNQNSTVHLVLAENGETLRGTFQGSNPKEKGDLIFYRVGPTDNADRTDTVKNNQVLFSETSY